MEVSRDVTTTTISAKQLEGFQPLWFTSVDEKMTTPVSLRVKVSLSKTLNSKSLLMQQWGNMNV